jgi:transposase
MRTKGSAAELEQRRRQAVALLDEGLNGAQVARALGVSEAAVSRWKQAYQESGEAGLAAKPHPGGQPRLTAAQRQRLSDLLRQGPRRHGYRTELWTLARVAEVIARRFGVQYHPCHVWRVLHGLGWSCQKPERRARERDEEQIARWRREDWPRIKKRPKKRPKHRIFG